MKVKRGREYLCKCRRPEAPTQETEITTTRDQRVQSDEMSKDCEGTPVK